MSSESADTAEPQPPRFEGPEPPELLPEIDDNGDRRSWFERLRPRRQQFVQAYVKHRNQTKAAAEVWPNYANSAHKGWGVIREPGVREAIQEFDDQALEEARITRVQILLDVNETKRRCMQASPVLDRKGNPVVVENAEGNLVPAYTFDSMGALRALELLGKNARLWADRTEISGPNGGPVQIADPDGARERNLALLQQVASRVVGKPAAAGESGDPETDGSGGGA